MFEFTGYICTKDEIIDSTIYSKSEVNICDLLKIMIIFLRLTFNLTLGFFGCATLFQTSLSTFFAAICFVAHVAPLLACRPGWHDS